jgi:hypothetical protein
MNILSSKYIVSEVSRLSKARAYNGVQDIVHIIAQTGGLVRENGRCLQEKNGNPPKDENKQTIDYQRKSP